ncbi:hypothetical protein BKA70DRAFT_1514724 [Coprinopsis sp. MPI-PUGE-AT-0042]|nr:hypothetical protein BKA70DRAFT_1514724 [Coprinopsis sp. MPI-PUGE-AT-0042]
MAGTIKLYNLAIRPGTTTCVVHSISSPTTTTTTTSSTPPAASMSARSVRSTSSSSQGRLRKPQPRVTVPEPVHWLFRTNIPRRRQSYIPASPGRRNFFGMESKRLLDEARQQIQETRERSQIRPTHTFSRLPGFYPRKVEQQVIKRALEGEPSFTLLFGPPSAGKTALLREILSHPRYHVLHFDLRIAGFADLESLYLSLSTQMEGFFEVIAQKGGWYESGSAEPIELTEDELKDEGWDMFEREAWSFKHDRITLQKRLDGEGVGTKGEVRPSDIARLMELFQSALLRYRDSSRRQGRRRAHKRRQDSQDTVIGGSQQTNSSKSRWYSKRKSHERRGRLLFTHLLKLKKRSADETGRRGPLLSSLMKHISWMALSSGRRMVLQNDCHQRSEQVRDERVLPRTRGFSSAALPPHVKRLDFETLYDAFGGKVAHWADFITDHVNSGGMIGIKQSSHFLQAHSLLNLHIIHSSQAPGGGFEGSPGNMTTGSLHGEATANMSTEAHRASPDHVLHPHLGAASFRMYQAGMGPIQATPSPRVNPLISSFTPYEGVGARSDFSPMQLLKVMSRFTTGGLTYLPYFHLCRELGLRLWTR